MNETDLSSSPYVNLIKFSYEYSLIHGYVALPVCIFGITSNALNIMVLSHRELRSVTNYFLTAIAACHLILNTVYTILTISFPQRRQADYETFNWTVFQLISVHILFITYGLSTWLTVDLALIRCILLKSKSHRNNGARLALKTILLTMALVLVADTPNYISFSLRNHPVNISGTVESGWSIGPSAISVKYRNFPLKVAFWINGFLFFLIPSILLVIFISQLIRTLAKFTRRRSRIRHISTGCWHVQQQTLLLLVILAILLTTQLPQAILNLMCSFMPEDFRLDVYQNLGELMELLSLVNASVGFILYCSMSSQFRYVFSRLVRESLKRLKRPLKIQFETHQYGDNANGLLTGIDNQLAHIELSTIDCQKPIADQAPEL